MKKKIYSQPAVAITEALQPMTIVCASITGGDPVTSLDPDPSYGD